MESRMEWSECWLVNEPFQHVFRCALPLHVPSKDLSLSASFSEPFEDIELGATKHIFPLTFSSWQNIYFSLVSCLLRFLALELSFPPSLTTIPTHFLLLTPRTSPFSHRPFALRPSPFAPLSIHPYFPLQPALKLPQMPNVNGESLDLAHEMIQPH
jgi:hypothetical protein